MKHATFELLKRSHLGDTDKEALTKAMDTETDPFTVQYIKMNLQDAPLQIPWNIDAFTKDFRFAASHDRLNEVIISFLLRLASIVREDIYIRSFQKPGSFSVSLAWTQLLKKCIYCILGLACNISWTDDTLFSIDATILKMIHEGNALALRELMTRVGISVRQDLYPAEQNFEKLAFLGTAQFSSFYWRLLHWMAEAYHIRNGQSFVKNMWRDLIQGPFYRSLRCGVCMFHFNKMLKEMKPRLMEESANHPLLFWEIHNKVHAQRREAYPFITEPDFSEDDYRRDAVFMRQALE